MHQWQSLFWQSPGLWSSAKLRQLKFSDDSIATASSTAQSFLMTDEATTSRAQTTFFMNMTIYSGKTLETVVNVITYIRPVCVLKAFATLKSVLLVAVHKVCNLC